MAETVAPTRCEAPAGRIEVVAPGTTAAVLLAEVEGVTEPDAARDAVPEPEAAPAPAPVPDAAEAEPEAPETGAEAEPEAGAAEVAGAAGEVVGPALVAGVLAGVVTAPEPALGARTTAFKPLPPLALQ